MKVLKDNYNKENNDINQVESLYPKKAVCEHCKSELEYERSDMRIGAFGLYYIDCPLCGKDSALYEEDCLTLTMDNIEFPTHFYHTSVGTGAVNNFNREEIEKYIRQGINYFRKNKDEYSWFCRTGCLHIEVRRWDGDEMYEVITTNDYYSAEIPFETEDY